MRYIIAWHYSILYYIVLHRTILQKHPLSNGMGLGHYHPFLSSKYTKFEFWPQLISISKVSRNSTLEMVHFGDLGIHITVDGSEIPFTTTWDVENPGN